MLVYDADCGPCNRFRRIVDWLDKYNRVDYISLVEADTNGLLDSIPSSRRHRSFHLISPVQGISSGSKAIPNLVSLLPLGRLASFVVQKAPKGPKSLDFVYSTLSRLHDGGSCNYKQGTRSSYIDTSKLGEPTERRSKEGRETRFLKMKNCVRYPHFKLYRLKEEIIQF